MDLGWLLLSLASAAPMQSESEPKARHDIGFQVRVVERGTKVPVAGATVECFDSEVRRHDSWRFRDLGDELWRQRSDRAAAKSKTTDEQGVARFPSGLGWGVTLVATTATRRGARVVLPASEEPAAPIELEVGPRRSIDVVVVDHDGKPVAAVPLEFGRFLADAPPRQHGDDPDFDGRCEIWDSLGVQRLTDEHGRATLDELELHGLDDLDVLRGAHAGPFGARVLVVGSARVTVPVDPDVPPSEPVTLMVPPIGRLRVRVDQPDRQPVEVDGEAEVLPPKCCDFAPGFPRFLPIRAGRAELFPVELGLGGMVGLTTEVSEDTRLGARWIRLGETISSSPFAYRIARIEARASLPAEATAAVEVALMLPPRWLVLTARLLWSDGTPAANASVDCDWRVTKRSEKGEESSSLHHAAKSVVTDGEGRIRRLILRPAKMSDLRLEFSYLSDQNFFDHAVIPTAIDEDLWRLDAGDLRFTTTPVKHSP